MPLSNLNFEQNQAATAPFGHNLVIASAGTGKTSTIVGRIAYLFENKVEPEEILLLTFTNKAAEEMIARVAKKFGESKAKSIQAGTFHAVSYKYLKEKYNIVLKQPRELKILFKSIVEKRVFLNQNNTPAYSSQYLYEIYSLYLNASKNQSFGEWLEARNSDQMQYLPIYEDIFDEFNELKKSFNYADYNDLLLNYREEMKKNPTPYKEVLCDEYQDTNPLQDSILDALNPSSLFCVGDYDQSIYAFNGADISIIANFTQKYKNAQVFTLSKNYRSSAYILDLANRVIQKNERIYPKKIEVVKKGDFTPPRLLIYDELFLQYQEIAKKIATGNPNFEEVAIIFRNNASADGCEASLRELGIPSKRKGGLSFFDTKEVALILDICSLLFNSRDMMAFIHTLSYGTMIGNSIAKDIYEAFLILGDGDIKKGILSPNDKKPYHTKVKNTQLGLFDDFIQLEKAERFNSYLLDEFASHPILSHPKFNKESALFLQNFYLLFKQLNRERDPKIMIYKITDSTFYKNIKEILANERSKNKDGSIDLRRKEEALEKIDRKILLLNNLAKRYDHIGKFLNAMILGSSEAVQGSGVNLLSIHASKGLEFQEVYVIDLMEDRFPNTKLIQKGGSLEEERRLFYVAVTRAKEKLFLSYARKDALKSIDYRPSIFLYEAGMILA
ncbi:MULTISPECIES: ATP-dependent helicase [unclassified Helicobacter]|uniref:ATP-dependent helicase n=1 Tax=unclassified Helicobacter TaxID=2593540 RepID=UPI000CF03034|nr:MULTISPECIES: ATP-dependent helicase [unclassified Helicobacter]